MNEKNYVPSASPSSDLAIIEPGIHLVKIDSVIETLKSDGTPKLDSMGYPGVTITFRTKKDENGNVPKISDNFYYDDRKPDDPTKRDPSTKCKSEWKLGNIRRALGYTENQTLKWEDAQKIAFWAQVGVIRYIHPDDANTPNPRVLKSYRELTHNYWHKDTDPEKLVIPGNPETEPDGEPKKSFVRYRVATLAQLAKWEGQADTPPQSENTPNGSSGDDSPEEQTDEF
jgi:hypothetical protein